MNSAKRHFKEMHVQSGMTFPCTFCNKLYDRERNLDKHMKVAHGVTRQMLKDNFVPDFKY